MNGFAKRRHRYAGIRNARSFGQAKHGIRVRAFDQAMRSLSVACVCVGVLCVATVCKYYSASLFLLLEHAACLTCICLPCLKCFGYASLQSSHVRTCA